MSDIEGEIRLAEAAFLAAGDSVAGMLDMLLPGSGDNVRSLCKSLVPAAHQIVHYEVAGAANELDYYGSY